MLKVFPNLCAAGLSRSPVSPGSQQVVLQKLEGLRFLGWYSQAEPIRKRNQKGPDDEENHHFGC